MANVLTNLSNIVIPFLIFYIIGYGIASGTKVYEDFVEGAKDGITIVFRIMPTMVGLMIAVGVLRSSGLLDFIAEQLCAVTKAKDFWPQLVPLTFIKMFSSSAATGLVLDIFKKYGTDSFLGLAASLMMSSTETIFYTMSVYFMAAKISKTRYTLVGALISTLVGTLASLALAGLMH